MHTPLPNDPAAQAHRDRRSRFWFALVLGFCWLLVAAGIFWTQSQRSTIEIQPTIQAGEGVAALKMTLPEAGAYRISQAELRQAGWQLPVQAGQGFQLLLRGEPLPYWIEGEADQANLIFYAPPSTSPYSSDNYVVLAEDAAIADLPEVFAARESSLLAQPVEPAPLPQSLPDVSYLALHHSEENLLYRPQTEGNEHWLWMLVSPGNPKSTSIDINQIALAQGGGEELARLRVNLYSETEAPAAPDHHLRLLVNGRQVAEERWDGRGWRQLEVWFDEAWLVEGENLVTLEAPGLPDVGVDLYHLDWIELAYPRGLQAQDDRLDFWSPGGRLTLSGFTAPVEVFDITDPVSASRLQRVEEDGSFRFETQANHRYLAVGGEGWLAPAKLALLVLQPDLRSVSSRVDYVALGPPDLLEPLQPLLDLRRAQGLFPMTIPDQAVYDQFNHGFPEPLAIQHFLREATQNWQLAPRFVLLVGDASYDPLGFLAPPEANRMPVSLVETIYGGQTASDVPYVQVNADGWPDLAVGIVPARTAEQVSVFVEKTLAYEDTIRTGSMPKSNLAIADGQEAGFASDAQAFLDLLGEAYPGELYAPPAGSTDAAAQIANHFSEGQALVTYFGHGSLKMWGKDRLFTVEDAAQLENTALPVVLSMTCLTGLYTHPEMESLADAFLFNPGGGAVAVLAPSSLTLAADQSFLSRPLAQEMLGNPQATLGEVHLAARRQIDLDSPGQRDVMMTFILFGDPALSLPFAIGGD